MIITFLDAFLVKKQIQQLASLEMEIPKQKRYIDILALDYASEKCTADMIKNKTYLQLDQDKVKNEFGTCSICYTIEPENNGIKFISSGDLKYEDQFYDLVEEMVFHW